MIAPGAGHGKHFLGLKIAKKRAAFPAVPITNSSIQP
jgi:hypothetical protein